MKAAHALLVTGPDRSHQVLLGPDETAYRRAFSAFVAAWGADAVWFDDEAKLLGSDGGVTLGRWRARTLGIAPAYALVVSVDGEPADMYLVDDIAMAERAVASLDGPGIGFDLVEIERLPELAAASVDDLSTEMSIRSRAGRGGRPIPPRAVLSNTFCPRCGDFPLHRDALFDAIARDGQRVCAPCGSIEAMQVG